MAWHYAVITKGGAAYTVELPDKVVRALYIFWLYAVMAYIVLAYPVMAYILMAYIVIAYITMACIVTAYIACLCSHGLNS